MSNLVLIYDEKFQHHLTPESHVESPNRLAAIEDALHRSDLISKLDLMQPRSASDSELTTVHTQSYIEELAQKGQIAEKKKQTIAIDADTFMSRESFAIAKLAAGAGLVAIDSIAGSDKLASFVAVRPPGHHALAATAMGFCLFNNVAIAARYAQKQMGIERVLILDWDVHHGNGTQDMFYNDPTVCFISLHQYPFWPPNSGWYYEDGSGDGKGYNINIPLPAGTGDQGYLQAFDQIVDPVVREFKPQLILLSAGYDAHEEDPLGQQLITTPGYLMLSNRLLDLAAFCKAKVTAFLEGGYNTRSLAESVVATMSALNARDAGERQMLKLFGDKYAGELKPVTADRNAHLVQERIADVRIHFARYWHSLR